MGVIEDVEIIKKELEEIKKENKKEIVRVQELNKIKKANKKLTKALILSIFAFIFLLVYTIIIVKC